MASLLELVMCSGMHSVKKCDFYHTDRCGENLHTHTHPPKKIDIQQFICMVAQYCWSPPLNVTVTGQPNTVIIHAQILIHKMWCHIICEHASQNKLCSLESMLCLNLPVGKAATQECKHNKCTDVSQIWFQSQASYKVVMNPSGGEIFCTHPDRPWGPPSLLYNGYRVFPRGKAAGVWCWPPTPISVPRSLKGYSYTSTHPVGLIGLL